MQAYYARAGVHEARGNRELAVADLSKVIELKPRTVFDTVAQTDAKKRVQAFGKQIPCGNTGSARVGETCR